MKRVLTGFAVLMFLFIIIIGFLFTTTSGLRLIFGITTNIVPGLLEADNVEGSVASAIKFNNLHYEHQGVDVEIQQLTLTNKWRDLLVGKINFLAQWQQAFLPITNQIIVHSAAGHLAIQGRLNNYHISLNAKIAGDNIPSGNILIMGAGNTQQLEITQFIGNILNGQLLGKGIVQWSMLKQWQFYLQGRHLNPGMKWLNFPGVLNFTLNGNGKNLDQDNEFTINLQQLSGNLSGHPVAGQLSSTWKKNTLYLNKIHLQLGGNYIEAQGVLGNNLNFDWRMITPKLSEVIPAAKGSILGQGSLTGSLVNPLLTATLQVQGLSYQFLTINQLNSKVILQPQQDSSLLLQAQNIHWQNYHINKLLIDAMGNTAKQTLNLQLLAQNTSINSKIIGTSVQQQWEAQVQQGFIRQLINGKFITTHFTGSLLSIKQNDSGSQLLVSLKSINKTPLLLNLNLSDYYFDAWPDTSQPLQGSIKLNFDNLSWLSIISPQITHSQGNLHGNFSISGTINKPMIAGLLSLRNGFVTVPQLGISLSAINFNAQGDQKSVQITGNALSAGSIVKLRGNIELATAGFPSSFQLSATHFLLMNTQQYTIYVTPDLKINYQEPTLSITGDIFIPYALLQPRDFSGVVEMPSNIVIIKKNNSMATNSNLNTVINVKLTVGNNVKFYYSGLQVKLGGSLNINFQSKQLTTALGQLNVLGGTYQAYGQNLEIEQGSFIYAGGPIDNPGLNLKAIRKINSFSNAQPITSSITMPNAVGLQINGTLKQPQVSLFSDPAGLDNTNILSYLVFGRPATGDTPGEGQMLTSALAALSSKAGFTQNIQNKLNLANLSVETIQPYDAQDNQGQPATALVIGKYITPRLYASYGVGLLNSLNILRLRYFLSKHWSIQTQADPHDQGADIIYTFETK